MEKEFVDAILFINAPTTGANSGEESNIQIAVDPNPNGLSIQDYYDGNPGMDLMGRDPAGPTPLTVQGQDAFKFVPDLSFDGEVHVIVPRGNNFIRVASFGYDLRPDGVFNQILSNLQF